MNEQDKMLKEYVDFLRNNDVTDFEAYLKLIELKEEYDVDEISF